MNGMNKDAMFRFNPGKQAVIFPPQHPYYKVSERNRRAIRDGLLHQDEYTVVPTDAGLVRIHREHGKGEREENIMVASYFANKYGYEIDLLPNPSDHKSADVLNKTLEREEEYKVNGKDHPTKSAIDNLLRKAKDQADHIVLWIESDISLGELRRALVSRVRRSENIRSVTLVMNQKDKDGVSMKKDCTYTREEIVQDGFDIKQADLK